MVALTPEGYRMLHPQIHRYVDVGVPFELNLDAEEPWETAFNDTTYSRLVAAQRTLGILITALLRNTDPAYDNALAATPSTMQLQFSKLSPTPQTIARVERVIAEFKKAAMREDGHQDSSANRALRGHL